METINNSPLRNGNFTSSEIVALTTLAKDGKSFGAPAKTYIAEKNMERRLKRSLDTDQNARPLSWGRILEIRAFQILGLEYTFSSQETTVHPTISYWSGSKDGIKETPVKTILEIKCPIALKSFCGLVDPIYEGLTGMEAMNKIRETHRDGEKYYWQIVSNAIINDATHGELAVYVPYKSELDEVRETVNMYDGSDINKHAWINFSEDSDLPHLIDGGYYKNMNIINFEIPQTDIDYLTKCVIEAGKLLKNY